MRLDRTVSDIATLLQGRAQGPSDRRLQNLRALDRAGPDDLSAVFSRSHERAAAQSEAGCLLVGERSGLVADASRCLVIVPHAEIALDALIAELGPDDPGPEPGVHPRAEIEEGAELGADVAIGPGCVVRRGARVGARSVLWANVYVGVDAELGEGCMLYPSVYIGARCRLGRGVVAHAHCSLGADGFGYRQDAEGRHVKSPQVGAVVVGDEVELGAHVTIDRGRFENTSIGAGCKLDDQVHVGHNVIIGEHCIIAGCTTFAGGAWVGDHVTIGGCSGIVSGVRMQDRSSLGGFSLLLVDPQPGQVMMGIPAVPHLQWKRQIRSIERSVRRAQETRDGA